LYAPAGDEVSEGLDGADALSLGLAELLRLGRGEGGSAGATVEARGPVLVPDVIGLVPLGNEVGVGALVALDGNIGVEAFGLGSITTLEELVQETHVSPPPVVGRTTQSYMSHQGTPETTYQLPAGAARKSVA